VVGSVLAAASLIAAASAAADTSPQLTPFGQQWDNANQITTLNDWSGVPGIIGYRGDDLTTTLGADPQSIVADGSTTPVDVLPNQTDPAATSDPGLAEFEINDPNVALFATALADAPQIVVRVSTLDKINLVFEFYTRDIDGSIRDAVQPIAAQFRVGTSGNFTNLPAGFIADATTGPSLATLVTPRTISLPASAEDQPIVDLRVITANASGGDEWVGIDGIRAHGEADADGDHVDDFIDNCLGVANADQLDTDGDTNGDACDSDDDGDGDADGADNCPLTANPEQTNNDADSLGDACDPDDDNDGTADGADNCALIANSNQANTDADSQGDACDPDDDNDGTADGADNCQLIANSNQANNDADSQGDACDSNDDNDAVDDGADNCALTANSDQLNSDGDPFGDVCDADDDNDGAADVSDLCLTLAGSTANGCPDRPRTLTLKYSIDAKRFKGALSPVDGCASNQKVKIFRKKEGPDALVGAPTTNEDGRFKLSKEADRGKHYAKVADLTVPTSGNCLAAKSKTLAISY